MLNALRTTFKETPYLKWILIAVGASLIAYLGNYFVGSDTVSAGNWVARVNGAEIPEWRFQESARNLVEYYRGLFGANYESLRPQLQLGRQALDALVRKELILQDAHRLGLRSSAAELADQIRNHPGLKDASGRFIGTERYKSVMQRTYRGGYASFERSLSEDLVERQWVALVTQPVTVNDVELREIFRKRTEKTSIDYVLLTAADQQLDSEPTEAELRGWYDDHLDDFMRDSGWNIRYVVIDRQAQLQAIEIGAAEIRAYYDSNQATYTHPEQRRARHILFRVEPGATDEEREGVRQAAQSALERAQGGEDFAALVRELSDDQVSAAQDGDLGLFGRGQMLGPFEDAAFSASVGELTPVTETDFGFHVIEVTDSRPAGVTALEEVEADIRRLLQFRQIDVRMTTEANRIRGEIGSADLLEQVAATEGLTVESGYYAEGEPPAGLNPSPAFHTAVSQLAPGAISSPLRVAAGLALLVVDETLPAAPAPFEEVRSEIATRIEGQRKLAAAMEAARKAHAGQTDLAAAATKLGLEVKSATDLAPGQLPPGAGRPTPEIQAALFGDDAREGAGGVLETPEGALVYTITGRETFDPERFETEKGQLQREALEQRRAQHLQAVIERLRAQQQIEYNAAWLETIDRT